MIWSIIIILVTLGFPNLLLTASLTPNRDGQTAATSVLRLAHRMTDDLINEPGNVVLSPLSIATALEIVLLGAKGQTYDELFNLLGSGQAEDSTVHHHNFNKLTRALEKANIFTGNGSSEHFVNVANGLFVQNGFSIRPDYQDAIKLAYGGEIFNVDFGDSFSTIPFINTWVNKSTHGKIQDIVPSQLDRDTKVLIASTLFFNAQWKTTFFDSATSPKPFYIDGKDNPPVSVDMMAIGGTYPSYESAEMDLRILAIPYKHGLSSMYIILPNKSSATKLKEVHRQLSAETINHLISQMTMKSAIILLPKMQLTKEISVIKQLAKLGVTSLFNSRQADLGLISDGEEQILHSPVQFGAPLQQENKANTHSFSDLEHSLIFSRISDDEEMEKESAAHPMMTRRKRNTYKVESSSSQQQPLRLKDFVLNKRIVKESKTKKKHTFRQKRDAISSLQNLENLRKSVTKNPGLYANEVLHKVTLTVNEKGTEGGAATIVSLYKTGTDVVFRVEEPFLFLIRHEETQLPLFYGAVFDPRDK